MKISMRVAAVKMERQAVKTTEKTAMNPIRHKSLLMWYRARIEIVGRREAMAMLVARATR